MTTTYGIISDIHGAPPQLVALAMKILQSEGEATSFIFNGDIAGEQFCGQNKIDEDNYIATILNEAAKTGLEIYVQPGSHEELAHFDPPVQILSRRYGNIINVLEHPKIEKDDHCLVFLPGSDIAAGNTIFSGYRLDNINDPSGYYRIRGPQGTGLLRITSMNDLRKYVNDPEKTIVVSHIPRYFDNLETAVDMAEFGEAALNFKVGDQPIGQGSIFPAPVAMQLQQRGHPIRLRKENRGNTDLRQLYEELGITKAISGHFHESVQRANDRQGKAVEESTYVNELFWNASHLDAFKVGLLSVQNGKVAYENINLRDYLR